MSDFEPASVFLTLLQGHLSNCSISSTPSNQPQYLDSKVISVQCSVAVPCCVQCNVVMQSPVVYTVQSCCPLLCNVQHYCPLLGTVLNCCQAQFQFQFQSSLIELIQPYYHCQATHQISSGTAQICSGTTHPPRNVTSSSPRKLKFGMQANFENIR